MNLVVVTHTHKDWKRDLTQVIASVKDALPSNSRHEIIEVEDGYNNFISARHSSCNLGDIVVFVDDDDYIPKDSLHIVKQAIEHTGAGIAFTREATIHENGRQTINLPATMYDMIVLHPQAIHHMTAFNTKHIHDRSLELSMKHGSGIEWIMRADAAYSGGAVYIPVVGYYWVQHNEQHHKQLYSQQFFGVNMQPIRRELEMWQNRRGPIPSYKNR